MDENSRINTKSIVCQGIINLLAAALVALPVLILFLIGDPPLRGFFCEDESLSHPYKDSTVTSPELYLYGFLVPLLFVLLVEILGKSRLPKDGPVGPGRSSIPSLAINLYFMYVGFLFGAAASQCLTDIAKYTIGRLRPHFFDVCMPKYPGNCTGSNLQPIYITDYTCPGNHALFGGDEKELQHRIDDSHLSFVSGHASFSFQASIFVMVYLQARGRYAFPLSWSRYFIVPFFQFAVLAAAFYISISRIVDNKHHPTDVIGGAIVGTLAQLLNTICFMKLFRCEDKYHIVPAGDINTVHVTESGNMDNLNGCRVK